MGVLSIFKRKELPKFITPDSNSTKIDTRYLELVLAEWLKSPIRQEQLLAEQYYDGNHDILQRKKKVIGADGSLVEINNVANNKLVDNQYRKLVDQKTNYVLGKPITIATEDDKYLKELTRFSPRRCIGSLELLHDTQLMVQSLGYILITVKMVLWNLMYLHPMRFAHFGKIRHTLN